MDFKGRCPRCHKEIRFNEICDECRTELKMKYNENLSSDVAFEIEQHWKTKDENEIFF